MRAHVLHIFAKFRRNPSTGYGDIVSREIAVMCSYSDEVRLLSYSSCGKYIYYDFAYIASTYFTSGWLAHRPTQLFVWIRDEREYLFQSHSLPFPMVHSHSHSLPLPFRYYQ